MDAEAPPQEPLDPEGPAQMTIEQAADLLEQRAKARANAPADTRPASRVVAAAEEIEEARGRFEAFVLGAVDDLQNQRMTEPAQILVGAVSALVVLLAGFLIRIARGRGELQVCLAYPLEMKGTFSIRLSPRKGGTRPSRIKTPEDAAKLGASTRSEHHMVARETSFRGLLPGTWYASAEGFVQAGESGEVVSTHFEELEAQVARRQVTRLEFNFQPRACPLEVRVSWDRRPVEGALLARRGAPGSMRMARGPVHFALDRGRHVIVAGNADRVAEVPVEVESFQPRQLAIDLAAREHLLFTGCPPAVAPYLNGDVPAAARALERDGQTQLANRLLARFHLEHGRKEAAARHHEVAGDRHEAAELWQSLCQFEKAATALRAVRRRRARGGQLPLGRQAAARRRRLLARRRLRLRRRVLPACGDVPRWIEALEKKGALFAAAQVALERGERARGIQCLFKVPPNDPDYPEAVATLIEAHARENTLELGAPQGRRADRHRPRRRAAVAAHRRARAAARGGWRAGARARAARAAARPRGDLARRVDARRRLCASAAAATAACPRRRAPPRLQLRVPLRDRRRSRPRRHGHRLQGAPRAAVVVLPGRDQR